MFGVRLPLNFNSPYRAAVHHRLLAPLAHDAVALPARLSCTFGLGGNRQGHARRYVNLLVTMLLGGLWHGAGWTFVLWGGLHGLGLVVHHAWESGRQSRPHLTSATGRIAGWFLTMLLVVARLGAFPRNDAGRRGRNAERNGGSPQKA